MLYGIFKSDVHDFFGSSIVLTTVDLVITPNFSKTMGKAHVLDSFGRIITDEVHDVFVLRDFRSCMQLLWGVHTLPFPIIIISGTLPVKMEKPLTNELYLQPNAIVVHRSSNCLELKYVLDLPAPSTGALYKYVQDIVRLHKLGEKEKGLIFVNSTHDRARLALALCCDFYCSKNHLCPGSKRQEEKNHQRL